MNEKLNITESVQGIYKEVPEYGVRNVSDCCNYTNQILDQFCASLDTVSSVLYYGITSHIPYMAQIFVTFQS